MSVYIIAALRFFVYSMTLMMMSIAGDLPSALVISACQTMSPAKDQRQRKMMYIMMSLVLSFSLSLSRTLFLFYVGTCISWKLKSSISSSSSGSGTLNEWNKRASVYVLINDYAYLIGFQSFLTTIMSNVQHWFSREEKKQ